jgi:hypothetical protein
MTVEFSEEARHERVTIERALQRADLPGKLYKKA